MTASRALRVVHVNTERGWRGGERQALWLAQGLQARGHVSVVAARPGEPLIARARDAGVEVVSCAPRFEADPVAAARLRARIRATDADIVHAHTAHAAGLAALATIGLRTRLVIARLLLDRALAQQLGDGARARVADFSIERMVERTEGIYRQLLGRRAES